MTGRDYVKKSKKLFIVGDKSSKARVIILSLVTLFFIGMFCSHSSFYILYSDKLAAIIVITIIVLIAILEIPIVATMLKHWDISEDYLEFYDINDYFQQWRYLISILKGREDVCAFKIKLTEIKSIKVYWNSKHAPYSTISYMIYFGITLKDGSIVTFHALVNSDKKMFLDAVCYLKERYFIQIDDKYNVLGVIADPNQNLHEYIVEVERKKFIGEGMEDD